MEHKMECCKCHTKFTATGPVNCPVCYSNYIIDTTLGGSLDTADLSAQIWEAQCQKTN